MPVALAAALGFAAFENVMYIFGYGLGVVCYLLSNESFYMLCIEGTLVFCGEDYPAKDIVKKYLLYDIIGSIFNITVYIYHKLCDVVELHSLAEHIDKQYAEYLFFGVFFALCSRYPAALYPVLNGSTLQTCQLREL